MYTQAMHADLCDGEAGLCSTMDPIDGELLKNYLLKVNFTGTLVIKLIEFKGQVGMPPGKVFITC